MNKVFFVAIVFFIILLIDFYVFQAVKVVTQNISPLSRKIIYLFYWGITAITILCLLAYNFVNPLLLGVVRSFMMTIIFISLFSKIFAVLFLLIDDFRRLVQWIIDLFPSSKPVVVQEKGISRSEFLAKTALIAGAVPAVTLGFGIISGAYDYRVRNKTVVLPNLPKAFDGIKIAQLSDIHSGSFYNKTAVKGGIEMLLNEKPDMVFFTGDLVNTESSEMKNYVNVFEKVKAPLGVYSTLGNHDYGDYSTWPSAQAKRQNLQNLMDIHKTMGWDLLMNENRSIKESGEQISIIGIENWGMGRFPKYGKMEKAYKGTEEAPVKLLLSHDPSHWDAQVKSEYKDIDLMFAGHTHGFQFGIEIGDFRWSPSQYIYKQWADLYKDGNQYLYVNRGFGFIGYPGRVGILPEITIIELKRS